MTPSSTLKGAVNGPAKQLTVACPHCRTTFRVDGSKIPAAGIKAKCSVCSGAISLAPPASTKQPTGTEIRAVPRASENHQANTAPSKPAMPVPTQAPHTTVATEVDQSPVHTRDREELMDMLIAGDRERRELAWNMTRELFRLREVVERQQTVVEGLLNKVSNQQPALPGPNASAATQSTGLGSDERQRLLTRQRELEKKAAELTQALEGEREVVERMRRGKLELERRTTDAESTLDTLRQRGLFDRILRRNED